MPTALLEREQIKTPVVTRKYDKRYFPRWAVHKRVEFSEEGGATFRSCTKDLSLDGASVFVFGNPLAWHRIRLRIHLTQKITFEARGRVAWSELGPTHQLFGVVFKDISEKAQALIMRHAFELRDDYLLINR